MVQHFAVKKRCVARVVTWLAAAAVFGAGVRYGTFIAADTDPYGYVSEAELIAAGTLHVDQRFTLSLPWENADLAFIPAGYKRATQAGFIVPTYPVGLPAVMALFLRVSGSRDAVYYVVPLLGAVVVLATGMLGARVHGRFAGAAAAVLVATSAPFLLQVIQPVSDVPAMAWWTVALALAIRNSQRAALGAGLAASMAIVTRPNLVPLAALIAVWYLWRAWSERIEQGAARSRLAIFALAALPGCLAVALINNALYGSPLASGYAPFRELYRWEHVLPNLDRYPRWLVTTQTPFIYFGVVALWVARRRDEAWLLFAFALVVLLSYIPYGVFGRDEWGYLRFLLPAFPALLFASRFSVGGRSERRPARAS
jgi:4-amino-4-deoxy-L-arabinose transferase-like glycosyltransferase